MSHSYRAKPRAVFGTLARVMGAVCRTDWRLEPGDMVWENRGARLAYSYAHAFSPGEVEAEASAAGLRPVFTRETGDGRVIVLAPD